MNRFDMEEHKIFLTKMAYDIGRTIVDLIAFKNGAGLLFLLDTLTDQNGRQCGTRTPRSCFGGNRHIT
jgi:hypothetical protein